MNERKQRRHRQDDERLPDLDAEVEGEERPAERRAWQIHLTQNVRKAEPVDETETKSEDKTPVVLFPGSEQAVDTHEDNAERDRRFDNTRGWVENVQGRQGQGNAVRDGKGGHDLEQLDQCAAKKEQSNDEEDVIGPDEDVVHTFEEEPANDGERILLSYQAVIDQLIMRGA